MKKIILGLWSVAFCLGAANLTSAETKLGDGTVLSDKPTWVVTYIEVAFDRVELAATLIKRHAESTLERAKDDSGNLRFEALQRIDRDNHFMFLEAWEIPEARNKHTSLEQTQAFRKALQPLLYAPYEERLHVSLEAVMPASIPAGNASTVYVVTHADISPREQFSPCARSADPENACGNEVLIDLAKDSRDHSGNLRFDVLTQSTRPNHMTVVEMWETENAQQAHQVHPDKKDFRDKISGLEAGSGVNADPEFVVDSLLGALWDERLYRLISD